MKLTSLLFSLVVIVLLSEQTHGTHLKAKLIKAKLIALKAPHVAAHIAVAKEIKAKHAIAFAKSWAAMKAARVAAVSALTAPFKIAKKTFAIKVGALKAAKALKIAKVAAVVSSLKKPILIPIPVPVGFPLKNGLFKGSALGAGAGFGVGALNGGIASGITQALTKAISTASAGVIGSGSSSSSSSSSSAAVGGINPLHGLITGAQSLISSAGSSFPGFLSTLSNGAAPAVADANVETYQQQEPEPVVYQEPIYRYVPNPDYTAYNHVHYSPNINLEIPVVHDNAPNGGGGGGGEYSNGNGIPPIPHFSYGMPH